MGLFTKGDFCRERVRLLIDLIDGESTKPIAVFTHHPPFEVRWGRTRSTSKPGI
jgi:hypothetical protein